MSSTADGTRERLITAAERLFAERGIDGVSLREITRVSGARNAIAVQYHFDDRIGVIRAILAKHLPAVEADRHALLDRYDGDARGRVSRNGNRAKADVRILAGALVRPLAGKLADGDGGREFLQIHADLMNRPRPYADLLAGDLAAPSLQRWRTTIAPLLDEDAIRLHRRFTAILHCSIELGRRARSRPRADDRLFTSYLVDVVTAILTATVSQETKQLADERDRRRRGRSNGRRARS